MRFKIRDKVRIIKITDEAFDYCEDLLNETGIIMSIDTEREYPYEIKFDNKELQDEDCVMWNENELELVECEYEYIGTYDEPYVQLYIAKIKAKDTEEAQSKFIKYIEEVSSNTVITYNISIKLLSDLEIIE